MRVFVSFRARSDIVDIYANLSERSPIVADRMLDRISQRFDELREFPFLDLIEANCERRCEGF